MAKRLSEKRPLEMARKRRSLRVWVVPCVIIILIAADWLPIFGYLSRIFGDCGRIFCGHNRSNMHFPL